MMPEVRIAKVPTYRIFHLLVSAKVLDLLTTFIAIKCGYGYEANPTNIYLLNAGGFFIMALVSILIICGTCLLFFYAQIYFDKPKYQAVFLKIIVFSIYLCFAINMIAVVNNTIVIFQHIM